MARIVTLGEIMLRLKSPALERFFQSPSLEATFGGGEANVAVSLANYGMDAAFVTALPNNAIGEAPARRAQLRRGRLQHQDDGWPHGHLLPGDRFQPASVQGRL